MKSWWEKKGIPRGKASRKIDKRAMCAAAASKNALGKLEGSGGGVGATDSAPRLRAKSSSASSGFDTQGHARGYNKNMIRLKNLYECERQNPAFFRRSKSGIHTREDHSVDPDEVDLGLDSIFIEVPRPPSPEAMFSIFQGSHKEFRSRPFEQCPSLCHNKSILELGAGGALPSFVAAESGARKVVITDYPDPDLIQNIEYNIRENADVVNPLAIFSRWALLKWVFVARVTTIKGWKKTTWERKDGMWEAFATAMGVEEGQGGDTADFAVRELDPTQKRRFILVNFLTTSTSSSDVLILALGVALAASYLFRDILFAASKPKVAPSATRSLNDTDGNPRDLVAKMKAGNKRLAIFYGSQTEEYAICLAKEAKAKFGLTLLNLQDESFEFSKGAHDLYGLKYVVFGLGNKAFEHYNVISQYMATRKGLYGSFENGGRGRAGVDLQHAMANSQSSSSTHPQDNEAPPPGSWVPQSWNVHLLHNLALGSIGSRNAGPGGRGTVGGGRPLEFARPSKGKLDEDDDEVNLPMVPTGVGGLGGVDEHGRRIERQPPGVGGRNVERAKRALTLKTDVRGSGA
ncbi:MAG: hypothetical protein NXY57DRAFT_1041537, partial [Lentinula lateritia]